MLGIVVYPIGSWEGFHSRRMLEALARNLRGRAFLLVVEPPAALLEGGCLRNCWPVLRAALRGTVQRDENLWLVRQALVGRMPSQCYVRPRTVRAALRRIGPPPDRLAALVFRPEQSVLLGVAGEDSVIYDCYDEYRVDFEGRELAGVREAEQHLLAAADLVLTTSQPLWESRSAEHPNVCYAPNGMDYALFARAQEADLPVPDRLAALPGPVVGYVGNFASWLDVESLAEIARALPEVSFVFIGPVTAPEAAARLGALPNVHFLGMVKYRADLAAWLKGMSATLCFFRRNEYTRNVRPLTVMEYLAAGKPTVFRPSPSVADLADLLYLANTGEEAVACIQRAIAEDSPELVGQRQARAREYDWDVLTRKTAEIILETCGG